MYFDIFFYFENFLVHSLLYICCYLPICTYCSALMYILCVSWLTAITMTVVHDRVPGEPFFSRINSLSFFCHKCGIHFPFICLDMNKYPPLPDIILDNIPHISWAFEMSEVTGNHLPITFLVRNFWPITHAVNFKKISKKKKSKSCPVCSARSTYSMRRRLTNLKEGF